MEILRRQLCFRQCLQESVAAAPLLRDVFEFCHGEDLGPAQAQLPRRAEAPQLRVQRRGGPSGGQGQHCLRFLPEQRGNFLGGLPAAGRLIENDGFHVILSLA